MGELSAMKGVKKPFETAFHVLQIEKAKQAQGVCRSRKGLGDGLILQT